MGMTAANVHDVQFLSELENIELNDCELIADKGYLSLPYQTTLFEQDKIQINHPLEEQYEETNIAMEPLLPLYPKASGNAVFSTM